MYYTLSPFVLDVNKDLLQSFSLSPLGLLLMLLWGRRKICLASKRKLLKRAIVVVLPFFIGFYLLQIVNIDIDLDH